jgi:hypothetical protein
MAVNLGQNFNQSHLKGQVSDYNRELTANEIRSLNEQGNIDYNLTLIMKKQNNYYLNRILK